MTPPSRPPTAPYPTAGMYTIPAPTFPVAAIGLAVVGVFGIIALGTTAIDAFSLVTANLLEVFFKALVIEASSVVEGWAFMRAKRWEDKVAPAGGLVITCLVSGVYNYTQAQAFTADKPLEWWQLWALAIGPLAATLWLSFSFGGELARHEDKKSEWLKERQAWLDGQIADWNRNNKAAQNDAAYTQVQLARVEADKEIEIAKSTPPAPVIDPASTGRASSIDKSLTEKVASMRSQGANNSEIVEALIGQGGSTQAAIARAVGVDPAIVTRAKQRMNGAKA